jgi:hypothetical protein
MHTDAMIGTHPCVHGKVDSSLVRCIERCLHRGLPVYAKECGSHADQHKHCSVCAETCQLCREASIKLGLSAA